VLYQKKTRALTEWGVRVWKDWALIRNCNSDVISSEFIVAAEHSVIDSLMHYFITEV